MAGKIKKRVPDIPVHKIPMKERIKKGFKKKLSFISYAVTRHFYLDLF